MECWSNGRRFTLIELIIITVVLVVAVGLMVPVMAKAREKERRVNCAGNLKSIGLALLMYSGESDGYFLVTPNGRSFEPLNTECILNNGKVYQCPSASWLATTARHSNYEYGGSGIKDDNESATTVSIARDLSGNHPGNKWMNVLFVDGHVEGARPDGKKTWNTYGRNP